MKKILLFLLPILFLTSCLGIHKDQPYTIYWIHMEGAPLRTPFDHWMDPFSFFGVKRPEVFSQKTSFYDVSYEFPKVWFNKDKTSPLLKNWLSVRGLETSSPHLKECRKEWFMPLKDISSPISFFTQTNKLKKIYEQNLSHVENLTIQELKNGSIFTQWKSDLNLGAIKTGSLNMFVLGGENDFSFEANSTIDSKALESYENFYAQFLNDLESFVETLKRRQEFQSSIILITSDRARIVTNENLPYETTTLWQGLNFSLVSGAIYGPMNIGHIQKNHPVYAESLPGTWGLAVDSHSVDDFHLMIRELLDAPSFFREKNKAAKNPWVTPRILQSLGINQSPGRIF